MYLRGRKSKRTRPSCVMQAPHVDDRNPVLGPPWLPPMNKELDAGTGARLVHRHGWWRSDVVSHRLTCWVKCLPLKRNSQLLSNVASSQAVFERYY